jgi:type IV secretion system protein TrbD
MAGLLSHPDEVVGFSVPVHRALTEPILLGGAPRSIAILNGTLGGAVGLGLRRVVLLIWAIGYFTAVWAGKRDPLFVEVGRWHRRSCISRPVTIPAPGRARSRGGRTCRDGRSPAGRSADSQA